MRKKQRRRITPPHARGAGTRTTPLVRDLRSEPLNIAAVEEDDALQVVEELRLALPVQLLLSLVRAVGLLRVSVCALRDVPAGPRRPHWGRGVHKEREVRVLVGNHLYCSVHGFRLHHTHQAFEYARTTGNLAGNITRLLPVRNGERQRRK